MMYVISRIVRKTKGDNVDPLFFKAASAMTRIQATEAFHHPAIIVGLSYGEIRKARA
jgi:hypothetical protein